MCVLVDVGVPVSKDYTGAWWLPAHADNIRPGTNHPKVLVLHTPEEPVDQVEVTPRYFSRQIFITLPDGTVVQRRASTHYYASGGVGTQGDGDLYQMVREDQGAIANGVLGKPYPADTDPNISLNLQSLSIEIEGYAANIHLTCLPGTRQWATVVRWVESRSAKYNVLLDRAHVIGHQEVANNRTDPGGFDIQRVIDEARALRNQNGDDDMTTYKLFQTWAPAKLWNIQYDSGVPMWRRWVTTQAGAQKLIAAHGEPETISIDELASIPAL